MSCVKALQTTLLYSYCTAEKRRCLISTVLYCYRYIYIKDIGLYNLL